MNKFAIAIIATMIAATFSGLGTWLSIESKSEDALVQCRSDLTQATGRLAKSEQRVGELSEIVLQYKQWKEISDAQQQSMIEIPATKIAEPIKSAWKTIATFSGNGAKNTESFFVPVSEWRIRWTARLLDEDAFGVLFVSVYEWGFESGDNKLVTTAVSQIEPGSDVSYVRGSAYDYCYLEVNASGFDWELVLEYENFE